MLNTFFIVDCDHCGQQFDRLALSLQITQNAEAITCLMDLLQQNGWHVFHDTYKCQDCILEEEYVNSLLDQRSPNKLFPI